MLTIGVIPNMTKDAELKYTSEIVRWILSAGSVPVIPEGITLAEAETIADETLYRRSDMLVVLGGDGTILQAAQKAAVFDKPILGINLGTLGYLTDVEKKDGLHALEMVLSGRYISEKRMMLSVDNNSIALNDVCVSRGVFSKLISIEISVNNEYMDTIRADGLIIATPTGSTAYNLSAGGPILKPDAEMIAITAICPHGLLHRPWVISARDVITLRVLNHADGVVISLDGRNYAAESGRLFTIRRSEYYTTILKTTGLGFYEILRRKMSGYENKKALENN